jgi:hypothetical protein
LPARADILIAMDQTGQRSVVGSSDQQQSMVMVWYPFK